MQLNGISRPESYAGKTRETTIIIKFPNFCLVLYIPVKTVLPDHFSFYCRIILYSMQHTAIRRGDLSQPRAVYKQQRMFHHAARATVFTAVAPFFPQLDHASSDASDVLLKATSKHAFLALKYASKGCGCCNCQGELRTMDRTFEVCVYVCMYVCLYVSKCICTVCMYVRMYVCTHAHTHSNYPHYTNIFTLSLYTCTHTHTPYTPTTSITLCMHVCMYVCMYARTHTLKLPPLHKHLHSLSTHTHTHTHTILLPSLQPHVCNTPTLTFSLHTHTHTCVCIYAYTCLQFRLARLYDDCTYRAPDFGTDDDAIVQTFVCMEVRTDFSMYANVAGGVWLHGGGLEVAVGLWQVEGGWVGWWGVDSGCGW
jgi:hypothetical protein